MIQTSLKQLCEAVKLQTYKEGEQGTKQAVGRLGIRIEKHPSLKPTETNTQSMLYLPYGPYDGTAASGTSGQSKGEIKGRGERQRKKEKEEITRTQQDPPPKHPPSLYWPTVYPFITHRSHLPRLWPLSFQNLWGWLGWWEHLHERCPRAAVFLHLSTDSPQQEGTPVFGEH